MSVKLPRTHTGRGGDDYLTVLLVVGGHVVDHAAYYHLDQLQGGDHHRYHLRHSVPETRSTCHHHGHSRENRPEGFEGVVRVHDRVNDEVHDDEPPGWGGVLAEGVPAVDEDRDVVVPVKEDQLLLPQHDEDRVPQLGDLGENEHPGPEPADPVLLDEAGDAEGVVEAVGVEGVHELGECPGGPHDAEHGQEHAPAREGASQVERRPEGEEVRGK